MQTKVINVKGKYNVANVMVIVMMNDNYYCNAGGKNYSAGFQKKYYV